MNSGMEKVTKSQLRLRWCVWCWLIDYRCRRLTEDAQSVNHERVDSRLHHRKVGRHRQLIDLRWWRQSHIFTTPLKLHLSSGFNFYVSLEFLSRMRHFHQRMESIFTSSTAKVKINCELKTQKMFTITGTDFLSARIHKKKNIYFFLTCSLFFLFYVRAKRNSAVATKLLLERCNTFLLHPTYIFALFSTILNCK